MPARPNLRIVADSQRQQQTPREPKQIQIMNAAPECLTDPFHFFLAAPQVFDRDALRAAAYDRVEFIKRLQDMVGRYIQQTRFQKKSLRDRRGAIMTDPRSRVVIKIFDDPDTFLHEMVAARALLVNHGQLNSNGRSLMKVMLVSPQHKTIVYENRFPDGVVLNDFLSRKLSWETAEQLIERIRRAVDNLHRHGLFHGDIKEDNILVNPETLDVQLIDIGDMYAPSDRPCLVTGARSNLPRCIAGKTVAMGLSIDPETKKRLEEYAIQSLVKRVLSHVVHKGTQNQSRSKQQQTRINEKLAELQRQIQGVVSKDPNFF